MSVARREGLPTIFPNDSTISPKGMNEKINKSDLINSLPASDRLRILVQRLEN
jgi:hypothetical protein